MRVEQFEELKALLKDRNEILKEIKNELHTIASNTEFGEENIKKVCIETINETVKGFSLQRV